jgi:hypothetical protein
VEMFEDVAERQERNVSKPGAGLDVGTFGRIMEEIQLQPNWRTDADKCCSYYDGNQLTQQELTEFEQRGIPPVTINLIKPTVNLLLGLEAKTRRDWTVSPDDDRWEQVAQATAAKLKELERETMADRACSEAYGSEIKAGMGWVEVSRNGDPWSYPYRIEPVHRREMFWQWQAKKYDLSDATYQVRRRWFPRDTVIAFFPQHAEMIRTVGSGMPYYGMDLFQERNDLRREVAQEASWNVADMEWRNTATQMVCLFEVWHRTYKRGYVLKAPGKTVEYDKKNPYHQAVVSSGMLAPEPAVYTQLKRSIWLGPHKMAEGTPRRRKTPYVPFWGYREDMTGIPYGVIRDWLSPQDEYNARRAKLLWLLNAKRVLVDGDALDSEYNDLDDLMREVSRPDMLAVLNKNRANRDALKIESDLGLTAQQFNVLVQDREAFRYATGLYQPSEGDAGGQAKSGIALQTLVEQGDTGYAEINDNYRLSRRLVGESAVDLLFEDMRGQPVDVMVGESGKRRVISLNKPVADESGVLQGIENNLDEARVKVVLEDTPSTATYKQQQNLMIGEVLKSLPPNLQAVLVPYWIEGTDLPKRLEMAKVMRKVLGLPEVSMDPEQEQADAMAAAQQQQMVQQLEMRGVMADIGVKEAQAMKFQAEAQKVQSEIGMTEGGDGGAESMAMRQEYEGKVQEMVRAHEEQQRSITEQLTQIRAEADRKVADALSQASAAKSDQDYKIVIANIAREQAIEVAKAQAAAQQKTDDSSAQLKALRDEFAQKLKDMEIQRKEEKLQEKERAMAEAAKADERKRKEDEQRSKESEREKKEKEKESKAEEKGDDKPAMPPITINAQIVMPKAGSKTIEIARPDGSKVTGTVKEDDAE